MKICQHFLYRLIDDVGDDFHWKNGSFKFDVDPYQFNQRLHHFSQFLFNVEKMIFKSWQLCDWLAEWLIILAFMNLRRPKGFRRSNVGLVVWVYV